jgi:hypothetical protein
MSRIKHQIQQEEHAKLKSLVQFTFGRNILNTNDCQLLAKNIFNKVKINISADTCRRFFGIIDSKNKQSIYTLDAFAKYIGFDGYYDFINSNTLNEKQYFLSIIIACCSKRIKPFEAQEILKKSYPSFDYYSSLQQLIYIAEAKKDRIFFKKFFIEQKCFNSLDDFKYEIYHTIQLLGKTVENNKWIQKIAIDHYYGLNEPFDYFVEWYVPIEQNYYSLLLENYKLTHIKSAEKLVFYNCIKALHHFKKNNTDLFLKNYKAILILEKKCEPNNILKARIMGVKALFHYIKTKQPNYNFLFSISFDSLFPDIADRVTSLFFLFNYLFEIKAFDVMINLVERWLNQEVIHFSVWTRINWNQLCVYMAIAYLSENKVEKASNYFRQIKPELFEAYSYNSFHKLYLSINKSITIEMAEGKIIS